MVERIYLQTFRASGDEAECGWRDIAGVVAVLTLVALLAFVVHYYIPKLLAERKVIDGADASLLPPPSAP